MTTDRWERLTRIFHDALSLSTEERARLLTDACADDAALRSEVERLIAAHERAGKFIESPAIASIGEWPQSDFEPPIAGRHFGPYRVLREIGRGGMGAVYLAERADGQFEQRVAIKLIKRGMDTDLLLERFRAERQILASLDHPNIGRLLDGGATEDGRPYFVMEYIEGVPVDEYADARRLSIPNRLRLFLDVCEAVSYAHHHRVVHRDIKPVNILVTADGVPKLLDFGIAKVLDPLSAELTSTVTGYRLLTPEYASPEQVQGLHATVGSDIYSLGVVLYELLTGRSPYRLVSRDPLEVAEAVRTTDPERPSTVVTRAHDETVEIPRRRGLEEDRAVATGASNTDRLGRDLRGDLDTIVLMALRKEPARRYQSVALFAEDIRRYLDGLPVRARPDGVRYRAGKFLRRNRPAVLAASIAGAAALILAASVGAFRGSARSDSPLVAGALASRDRVLVADFADRARDPALASAVSEAFRVDLTQSPFVHVLSTRQLRSALTRMERSPDLTLDDTLAREVAVREGVKAIVTGSVTRVTGRYTINAQLVSAEKGELLAAERETAVDSDDIIPAIGKLSARLRRGMGESLSSIRASPPLEQVTTTSLPALRAYSDGLRIISSGDRDGGVRQLQRAVALDTAFASAYRVMGITYGDMAETGQMATALEHAIANQNRLSFYERWHTLATYAYAVQADYDAAIVDYHRILERYPDDVRALNNLGYVYSLRRQFAVQESLLVRAMAADSTNPIVQTGLVMARANTGEFSAGRTLLDRVESRFPGLHNAVIGEIYLSTAQQNWQAAERQARARLALSSESDSVDGQQTLAGIVLTQGRIGESERYSHGVLHLSAKLDDPHHYLYASMRHARVALVFKHDTAAALGIVDGALKQFPLDSLAEGDRPYYDIARFLAVANRSSRARALVAEAGHTALDRRRRINPERAWTLGVIALAEGRPSDALTSLREAVDLHDCPICVLPDLARAYEAAGQRDSAIAVYERYLATPWEWRFETDGIELGRSLHRVGELYEQRGDRAKAAASYRRLLDVWRSADHELQPVLMDARRRLVVLSSG